LGLTAASMVGSLIGGGYPVSGYSLSDCVIVYRLDA
jgi:hypothetical protein